jgi:NhaP-type Na+/H+ or K+/H+ antiporter
MISVLRGFVIGMVIGYTGAVVARHFLSWIRQRPNKK